MKYKHILFWIISFVLLGSFLQQTAKFHFFYLEQLQLFQFTTNYVMERIIHPGGLALLLGEFLTQFYLTDYAGPLILSTLLIGTGIITQLIIKRICPTKDPYLLYLLPSLALLLAQYDFNFSLQGIIAYIMLLKAFYLYMRIPDFTYRLIGGLTLIVLLFWWAGPAAGLFALCAVIWETLNRTPKGYLSFALLAGFMVIAIGSVWSGITTGYHFAFLPAAYYHPLLPLPTLLYVAWACLPICLFLAFSYPKKKLQTKVGTMAEPILHLVIILVICWYFIPRHNDAQSYPLKELDYYSRTTQWDRIINKCQGPLKNYLFLAHLNMALAEKGQLADRMFSFDQHGPQGLLTAWNKTFSVSTLLSDAYFTLGEIALSQQMAFEAYVTVTGAGNPRNLQRLIQTNLIFGAYPIAEKYIRILERTFAYRKWAKQHRAFLYNDKAVESDPLLGKKRKGLPSKSTLAGINGLDKDLLIRAEQNPENQNPIQFAGAFYLLSKDMKSFQALIETYYGTPTLPSLPISFQEAVILLAERDTEYWKRFNLSETVLRRFADYRTLVMQNRGNAQLPQLIKHSFGNTYWCYYILN